MYLWCSHGNVHLEEEASRKDEKLFAIPESNFQLLSYILTLEYNIMNGLH